MFRSRCADDHTGRVTDATTAESRVAHLLALHRLDEAERTARAALTAEPQDPGLLAALWALATLLS